MLNANSATVLFSANYFAGPFFSPTTTTTTHHPTQGVALKIWAAGVTYWPEMTPPPARRPAKENPTEVGVSPGISPGRRRPLIELLQWGNARIKRPQRDSNLGPLATGGWVQCANH